MENTSQPSLQSLGINPVWGFDPIDLLKKTHFPNDENEYKIRHSRQARIIAIRKLYDTDDKTPNAKKINIFSPGLQQPDALPQEQIALQQTNRIQQLQLARSAAALTIQAVFRGWATRRRYISIVNQMISIRTKRDELLHDSDLPTVKDLKIQERLWKKFLHYSNYIEKRNSLPPEFSWFCAALIQSAWRRFVVYRAYKKYRGTSQMQDSSPTKETEELQEQAIQFLTNVSPKTSQLEEDRIHAAHVIQRAWKSYYNIRIFSFYRDLIRVRQQGDPFQLLKYINPKEANLIDKSMSFHIRFRLGGSHFPPTIYYKIFLHRNLVDINAFAPRDYTNQISKQLLPKQLFSKETGPLPKKTEKDEWYNRVDLNNWRPVMEVPGQLPLNTVATEQKKADPFHYSKLKRKEDLLKKRKLKQLEWMKKLYEFGKNTEKEPFLDLQKGLSVDDRSSNAEYHYQPKAGKSLAAVEQELNQILVDIENHDCSNELINWTRALDFDEYHQSWLSLAATAPSDYYEPIEPRIFQNVVDSIETNVKAADPNEFVTPVPSERRELQGIQEHIEELSTTSSVENLFLQTVT